MAIRPGLHVWILDLVFHGAEWNQRLLSAALALSFSSHSHSRVTCQTSMMAFLIGSLGNYAVENTVKTGFWVHLCQIETM